MSLAAAGFMSSFDRFAIGPMLVVMATDLGEPLAAVVALAGAYFLAYGLSQPLWGVLSDRLGRVRLIQFTLLVGGAASIASGFAPNLAVLLVLRIIAGACFGAVVPTSLTYVGDTVELSARQRALSDLMATMAVGTALATALSGLLAHSFGWRSVFVLSGVCSLIPGLLVGRLPEPQRAPVAGNIAVQLQTAIANRWALLLYALVMVEGGALLGMLTLLPPALSEHGVNVSLAGLATAAYGVGVMAFSRLVRPLARRWPMWGLLLLGGVQLAIGFALVSWRVNVVTVLITSLALGGGWAFMHSSLQTWATSVVPQVRGTVVALFAGSLFVGSSLATYLAAPWADTGHYQAIFAVAAVVMVPLTLVAVLGRISYLRHTES
ncbi:putative MFS family arabinose efflux permease [Propionibacteriaceae bacterium ES.041]|nr:putative MFS family arabinose efflux permease [Propionibacteriaceae bacterium ES.041]